MVSMKWMIGMAFILTGVLFLSDGNNKQKTEEELANEKELDNKKKEWSITFFIIVCFQNIWYKETYHNNKKEIKILVCSNMYFQVNSCVKRINMLYWI